MALQALKRLTIDSAPLCHKCSRAFASSALREQSYPSATSVMTAAMQNSRPKGPERPQRSQPSSLSRPADLSAPRTQAAASQAAPPNDIPDPFGMATSLIRDTAAANEQRNRERYMRELAQDYTSKELAQQVTRYWRPGDVYAPHDLSGAEMSKWKRMRRKPRARKGGDVMDQLGMDPVEQYKNFSIMSEYVTDMGRIRHSNETGLRPVNQRKMAKAIRRAIGIGLIPSVYRHPEILRAEMNPRDRQ